MKEKIMQVMIASRYLAPSRLMMPIMVESIVEVNEEEAQKLKFALLSQHRRMKKEQAMKMNFPMLKESRLIKMVKEILI